jgi:hypothetical protein
MYNIQQITRFGCHTGEEDACYNDNTSNYNDDTRDKHANAGQTE